MLLKNMFIKKKNSKFGILIGISSLMFLSGCANPDQVTVLEKRLNSLAIDNASMRQEINQLKRTGGVGPSQASPAAISNRIDELQAEILRINGRLDQVTYTMEQELSRIERLEQAANISSPPSPGTTLAHVSPEKKEPSILPEAPKPAPPEPPKVEDPYQKGMNLFNQKEYKEAKKSFQEYVEKNPSGDLADNAYFMMGESEFKLERYEEAILDYQKVIDKFPKSNKTPEALFKQGEAFAKLGDNIGAKIVFKKLIKKYPKSSQAKDAKAQISKLR